MILESCKGIGIVLGVLVCFCPNYWIWGYPSNSWHIDYGTDCSKQMVLEIESCYSRENIHEQECAHPHFISSHTQRFSMSAWNVPCVGQTGPQTWCQGPASLEFNCQVRKAREPQVTPWGGGQTLTPFGRGSASISSSGGQFTLSPACLLTCVS